MFGLKSKQPRLIFIVEDNTVYAKTLESFLKARIGNLDVKIFPVGELCIDNLHLKPDVIIMDYFLNTKYYDAENGLSILKQIRQNDQEVRTIVLSAQNDASVVLEVSDTGSLYLVKNENAFQEILDLIGGPLS